MEIVFTAQNNLLGRIIRFFTRRSWVKSARVSHVALRYGGEESKWMVESNRHGFVPNWWPRYLKDKKVYKRFKILGIKEKPLEKIVDKCIDDLMHKKYDFFAFLGFGLSIIWYWISGHKAGTFMGFTNAYYCSESIAYIMGKVSKESGNKYFSDYSRSMIFPEELLIDCETKENLFLDTGDSEE